MDWLKTFIKNNSSFSIFLPTTVGVTTFFANLLSALSDGKIDGQEFHQLMSSASGVETLLLVVIMIALK